MRTFVFWLWHEGTVGSPKLSLLSGKVREYFGYEPTFPIDMKICNEVGEYKNSGDMNFLNDVVKDVEGGSGSGGPELGGGTEKDESEKTTFYKIKLGGTITTMAKAGARKLLFAPLSHVLSRCAHIPGVQKVLSSIFKQP